MKRKYDDMSDAEKEKLNAKKRADEKRKYDNLNESEKEQLNLKRTPQKAQSREKIKLTRQQAFDAVQDMQMTDLAILKTEAFNIVKKDFFEAINEGPIYTCDICWKFEFRRSVKKLHPGSYDENLYEKCKSVPAKSLYICKKCDRYMKKGKMPAEAQANSMKLCPSYEELNTLCPLEHQLISPVLAFMHIVARVKGAQHGLKGQVILVPTDMNKINNVLPRNCADGHLLTVELKRRLSDQSAYNKQNIRPALVNRALDLLREINPLFANIIKSNDWEQISAEHDEELWNLLTDEDFKAIDSMIMKSESEIKKEVKEDTTDHLNKESTEEESEPVDFAVTVDISDSKKEDLAESEDEDEQIHKPGARDPTVLHRTNGYNIKPEKVIGIAPGEGKIPTNLYIEPNAEALAFPKLFPTGNYHFNTKREVPISVTNYLHTRLKSCDPRFASNVEYIFYGLDWKERVSIMNAISFSERKYKQSNISVAQLRNPEHVKKMISENELFATFKNIMGTPQYFYPMKLDMCAKVRQLDIYTFFITFTADQLGWPHIIKAIAAQYGVTLTDEEIRALSFHEKCVWLKRNPVTAARMIDNTFTALFGKVLMSGMHPIGKILNFDERSEFQGIGVKHIHVCIHVHGAPIIGKQSDEEVIAFIDKYISCSIPDKDEYPDLNELIKLQTHSHTQTCRKKKTQPCRFYFPQPPTDRTIISRAQKSKSELRKSKAICLKVEEEILRFTEEQLASKTIRDILSAVKVSETDYYQALNTLRSKMTILYKRKVNETHISPYCPPLLALMRSNMNIQFITDPYGVLHYLAFYICKPEKTMSELMKKACKESNSSNNKERLSVIGKQLLRNREVPTHEAIMRILSMPLRRSNIDVIHIPTGPKENITRVLKSKKALDAIMKVDPNSEDIFACNMLERYASRPLSLNECCYAFFASNYKVKYSINANVEDEDSLDQQFGNVPGYVEVEESGEVITLQNGFGDMRKRSRPCVVRWHSISKTKNPEMYYMRLLQLYLPWRKEEDLLHEDGTYTSKFNAVRDDIIDTIQIYEPVDQITEEEIEAVLATFDFDSEDEEDTEDPEFAALNPENIDERADDQFHIPLSSGAEFSTRNACMENDEYYKNCKSLNDEQRSLFQFVCTHTHKILFSDRYGTEPPEPFFVFLSGDGGTGKSHLINVINEYVKRNLKFPGQSPDQPSILLTASTGPAASRISGQTLHKALNLNTYGIGSGERKKKKGQDLGDKAYAMKFLKIIVIDEISMVGERTLYDTYLTLSEIMGNEEHYGGVSVIAVGDLYQLPPVRQFTVFSDPVANSNEVENQKKLAVHIWKDLFKFVELTKNVRQAKDPFYAEVIRRVRTGEHTPADYLYLKELEYTDTRSWPGAIYLYLTNLLVDSHNDRCLLAEGKPIYVFTAKDSIKDEKTQRADVKDILKTKSISQTRGLRTDLKICVNARVFLTQNLDTADHLVNGALGTVVQINVGNNSPDDPYIQLNGVIYVQFDKEEAGNKRKQRHLPGQLSQCVPIVAETKDIDLRRDKRDKTSCISLTRKQYPLQVAYALTIHKSQGSQFDHIVLDFNRANPETGREMSSVPNGSAYTGLSRATTSEGIVVKNFSPNCIRVSEEIKKEYHRLRNEKLFTWEHPTHQLDGCIISFLNIVKWDKHIEHFLSDPVHLERCCIFSFVETNITSDPADNTTSTRNSVVPSWVSVFKHTRHGICLMYNQHRVQLLHTYDTSQSLELLACRMKYEEEEFITVILYRPPDTIGTFMADLTNEISRLPTDKRIIILGDFNLDLMKDSNKVRFEQFSQQFSPEFHQISRYSTHRDGSILDLCFDNDYTIDYEKDIVKWLPTPFSDHFILYKKL